MITIMLTNYLEECERQIPCFLGKALEDIVLSFKQGQIHQCLQTSPLLNATLAEAGLSTESYSDL